MLNLSARELLTFKFYMIDSFTNIAYALWMTNSSLSLHLTDDKNICLFFNILNFFINILPFDLFFNYF